MVPYLMNTQDQNISKIQTLYPHQSCQSVIKHPVHLCSKLLQKIIYVKYPQTIAISWFIVLAKPCSPKLSHVIYYYQGDKKYPCLEIIRFDCQSYTPVTHLLIARQSLLILTDHLIYSSVLCESLWYFFIVKVQCCLTDCAQGKILLKIQYTSSPFNHFQSAVYVSNTYTKENI